MWFLGRTRVHNPHGISIDSAVLAQLTVMSSRQRDRHSDRHAHRSRNIGNSKSHHGTSCLRCGLIITETIKENVTVPGD